MEGLLRDSENNKVFLGQITFGRFKDKTIALNTYYDTVYLHIRNRTKGSGLSLRASEYFQLLRLREQILKHIEAGAKLISKTKQANLSETDQDFVEYESDNDLENVVDRLRKQQSTKRSPEGTSVDQGEKESVKLKKSKPRKKRENIISSDSEDDTQFEKKKVKQAKKNVEEPIRATD